MKKKITILGSTGSIGTQALEVVEKLQDKFEIIAMSAGDNVDLLSEQIKKFNPKTICTKTKEAADRIKGIFPTINTIYGENGLIQLCKNKDNNMILVAVSGRIGLKPTITAIENGIDIALANKETLVMAGDIVMKMAKDNNVKILPVDSEHSAIHQSLKPEGALKRLIITASGGPFRNSSIEEIKKATVKETLAHPKWNMGKKITVDSATLMNKGLEVIEAHHLFDIKYDDIKVVVHPQSILHSAVEYLDGSVVGQIGLPSMHIPIQYALTYPERVEGIKTDSFDFVKASRLDFEEPDFERFPCLKLAYEAGKIGGTYPLCLNAANEEAVFAFLEGKIALYNIYKITKEMMDSHKNIQNPSLEEIFKLDDEIRQQTRSLIEKF